ncbi:hypothetical protein [Botryobacter ruber]|uniref:hypothetical protein n=1 Tax=Botryobacter ruber TaxID=2171629 RepID=UPI0013E39761|nr:hypothetical protein [Botryobacter ruber]
MSDKQKREPNQWFSFFMVQGEKIGQDRKTPGTRIEKVSAPATRATPHGQIDEQKMW